MTFDGVVSRHGPYLSCRMGGVALGIAGLRHFQPTPRGWHIQPRGWWVVKYQAEERIYLPAFDQAAIRALSDEFGLPVLTDHGLDPFDDLRQDYFFTSPAWEALRWWVIRHPLLAKAHAADDPYLWSWYDRAIREAMALAS
jgi:hypothetical protein